jgi:hypothetical protein
MSNCLESGHQIKTLGAKLVSSADLFERKNERTSEQASKQANKQTNKLPGPIE